MCVCIFAVTFPLDLLSSFVGKMGCLGNSKTEDQRNEEKAQREANKKIEKQLQKDKQIYRATHRLLLLGESSKWEVLCCVFGAGGFFLLVFVFVCLEGLGKWRLLSGFCFGVGFFSFFFLYFRAV